MTWPMVAAFALALLVNAGMPGPSIAALVSRVITNGVRDVLPFLAAMWFGEVVWMTLAVTGLSSIAEALGSGFTVIRFAGAGYLLFLAWKMWRAPVERATEVSLPRTQPMRMFTAGLMVTFGNPKIMVFYLALLPTLIPIADVTVGVWAQIAVTMVIVLVTIDLAWSLLASRARRLLSSHRARRTANRASASAMAGAAILVATK